MTEPRIVSLADLMGQRPPSEEEIAQAKAVEILEIEALNFLLKIATDTRNDLHPPIHEYLIALNEHEITRLVIGLDVVGKHVDVMRRGIAQDVQTRTINRVCRDNGITVNPNAT